MTKSFKTCWKKEHQPNESSPPKRKQSSQTSMMKIFAKLVNI